tara:strand:- start:1599 stop:2093 length:495 start_codon:yes stop_codon:yes gene_type:complete
MYSFNLVDTLIDYPPIRSNMSQARDDNKPDEERPEEMLKDVVETFLKEVPKYEIARDQPIDIDTCMMRVSRVTTETTWLSMDEFVDNRGDVEDAVYHSDWETEDYETAEEGNWMSSQYVPRHEYKAIYDQLKEAEKYLKAMLTKYILIPDLTPEEEKMLEGDEE